MYKSTSHAVKAINKLLSNAKDNGTRTVDTKYGPKAVNNYKIAKKDNDALAASLKNEIFNDACSQMNLTIQWQDKSFYSKKYNKQIKYTGYTAGLWSKDIKRCFNRPTSEGKIINICSSEPDAGGYRELHNYDENIDNQQTGDNQEHIAW